MNYEQMQKNFKKYFRDNDMHFYEIDARLEKMLADNGYKQSKINKACVYYGIIYTFLGKKINEQRPVCHQSINTVLHFTEDEDRNCWKALEGVGMIKVYFEKKINPSSGRCVTERKFQLVSLPFDRNRTDKELEGIKKCWVDGIKKFDLTVDEAVIMATLMFEYKSFKGLMEATGLSDTTVKKCLKHLRELSLLGDTNVVNYLKCGVDIDDEYHGYED